MFAYVVLSAAFLLAACAAWFSVSGIAQLFAGAGFAAGFMAGALELGKLVGVSFLYRYRNEVPKLLRTYMWIGTVVLMLITSVGIYGYLSSAYASSATDIQQKENQIRLYTTQQQTVEQNIKQLTDRSTQLQNLRAQQENRLDEFVRRGRGTATQQAVIREQDAEIKKIQTEVATLSATRDSIALVKTNTENSISTTGKLGTFYYVAQTLGVPLDTIVKWFIVVLVLVFDPMSISLFVAYNVIVDKKSKNLQVVLPPRTDVESSEVVGDVAPLDDGEHFSQKKQENDTIESTTIPYYMQPGYDWANDTRWHDDPAARGFRGTLGY
jgi:hypothetical protein